MSKYFSIVVASLLMISPAAFALDSNEVSQMNCGEAMNQLDVRLEFYAQLSDAYLLSLENLETVYRKFGPQVAGGKDNEEIARHFGRSAERLKSEVDHNRLTLETLKSDSALLKGHLAKNCTK